MTNPTIDTYNTYADVYDQEVIEFWDNFPQVFIEDFVAALPGKKILNLGSGSGRDALLLRDKGLEVVCVDASEAMVAMTKSLGFESYMADFQELPFVAGSSFAGAWAYTSLIHIPKADASKVIKNLHSLLKSDGLFAFGAIEGNSAGMIERQTMPGAQRYFKMYSRDELKQLIEPLGFKFLYEIDYKPHSKTYLSQLYLATK